MDSLRIGNACGFWGDSPSAPARLVAAAPEMDVLTLDYLAEVSMSILAKQRQKNPKLGYPQDFVDVVRSLTPAWKSGRRLTVVSNGGGLDPHACADACAAVLREAGVKLKIGIVSGDDVLPLLKEHPESFRHLETGQPLRENLLTANAYLGADGIATAILQGAQLVITGRVADPSLTVGPWAARFNPRNTDLNPLAGATVAGHLIECGQQVTGGISTHWLDLPNPHDIGYPIVELSADGSCIVTKPPATGGQVSERTVKEQLLYEIGDPDNYLSPDVTVSFLGLKVEDQGGNRVRVTGAMGREAPDTYKVSATYAAGYNAAGTLTIVGRDAATKAQRCGEVIRSKLQMLGICPKEYLSECIGSGDQVVLRVAAADEQRDVIDAFSRELMPLVTGGPQGTTGYATGRPAVREAFGYWPTLVPRQWVRTQVDVIEV
jgi:hypothetical protein